MNPLSLDSMAPNLGPLLPRTPTAFALEQAAGERPLDAAGGHADREVERLEDVAGEFEAIFLRQLLKEMKASSAGSLGDGSGGSGGGAGGSGSHVFDSMGVDSMAQALMDGGGFGLRDVLIDRLGPHVRATAGGHVAARDAHDAMTGDSR